jgi:hypothetical protein
MSIKDGPGKVDDLVGDRRPELQRVLLGYGYKPPKRNATP